MKKQKYIPPQAEVVRLNTLKALQQNVDAGGGSGLPMGSGEVDSGDIEGKEDDWDDDGWNGDDWNTNHWQHRWQRTRQKVWD